MPALASIGPHPAGRTCGEFYLSDTENENGSVLILSTQLSCAPGRLIAAPMMAQAGFIEFWKEAKISPRPDRRSYEGGLSQKMHFVMNVGNRTQFFNGTLSRR